MIRKLSATKAIKNEPPSTPLKKIELTARQKAFPISALNDFLPIGCSEYNRKSAANVLFKAVVFLERRLGIETVGDLQVVSVSGLLAQKQFGHRSLSVLRDALIRLSECEEFEYNPPAKKKDWPALLRNFVVEQERMTVTLTIPATMFCELLSVLGEVGD